MVALESSKLFSSLSKEELQALLQIVQIRAFPPGAVIFTEGDQGDGLYLVKDGSVKVSALVPPGERRALTTLGQGDFFGEMAIVDHAPRSATITAEEPTEVYFIPKEEMEQMLINSPRLAVNLVREFSLRLRDFNRRYIDEVIQVERLALVGRFARGIVHDFKNPLNVIGLAADLAGMENATPAMRQMARNRIHKQVDRLSSMINELLEFSRGSQDSMVLAQSDYALFIRRLLQEIREEVNEYSITIELENEPPSIFVLIDPQRLVHLFWNIIHNSVDVMPEGGRIVFRFIQTDKELITEIEDSGPGIAPEIMPRLFEAFATYGKSQGTGLGLSICKRIVEDHHGRIEARNRPGGGAIFAFVLPLPPQ